VVVVVVWPGAVEMVVVVVVFLGPTWFTSCASLAVMRRLNSPVRPPYRHHGEQAHRGRGLCLPRAEQPGGDGRDDQQGQ